MNDQEYLENRHKEERGVDIEKMISIRFHQVVDLNALNGNARAEYDRIAGLIFEDVREWLSENIFGKYEILDYLGSVKIPIKLYFYSEEDAVAFKLAWS